MSEETDIPDESPPDQPEIPQPEDTDPIDAWPPETIEPITDLPGDDDLPDDPYQDEGEIDYSSPPADTQPDMATDTRPAVFPATIASWGQGTAGTWTEQTIIYDGTSSTMSTYTDGRSCGTLTTASGITFPKEAAFLVVEQPDLTNMLYWGIPNGDFNVYVTQNGGSNGNDGSTPAVFPTYTYNVFLDASKTIQIGTALSVLWHRLLQVAVTAGTHGRARIEGKTVILLEVDEYFDRDSC